MDQTCSRVTISHLCRDLALVRDEERSRHRRVPAEDPVDLSGGPRADSCEDVGTVRLQLSRVIRRSWRGRARDDRSADEYNAERDAIDSSGEGRMNDPRRSDTESSDAERVEPDEQAAGVGDVGGGDEGQRGSGQCRRTLHLELCSSEIIREAVQPNGRFTPRAEAESAVLRPFR